jgi:hypothetical protein
MIAETRRMSDRSITTRKVSRRVPSLKDGWDDSCNCPTDVGDS